MRTVWGTRIWLDEVRRWIADSLTPIHGMPVGDIVPHATQPWSTVWTVDCAGSRYWFKANRQSRREGAVQAAVADLVPEYVDAPIAWDSSRGWILTRDRGKVLLQLLGETGGMETAVLAPMLVDYALLQRRTLSCREVLLAAGVRTARPENAAAQARVQASYLRDLPDGDPRRITDDDYARVIAALPLLHQAATRLLEGRVPLALDQCDLWPGNVFPPAEVEGYRFIDFADAVWAHPFGSLVMLAVECVFRWQVPQPDNAIDLRDSRIRTVFDAYLRQWIDFAPLDELRDLAGCALRIAALHRAAAWLRNLAEATPEELATYGSKPWAWLEDVTKPVLV